MATSERSLQGRSKRLREAMFDNSVVQVYLREAPEDVSDRLAWP